jgi:hypothetical protein
MTRMTNSAPSGQAWVFLGRDRLTRPVVLAADTQAGPTDMATVVAGLDHESYSFLSMLRSRGRDLVVVGYGDGKANLDTNANVVIECVRRTLAERLGSAPLTVGGIGRGALMTRYGLVKMETQRVDHETAVYFSYNGAAPSPDEAGLLEQVGSWPQLPRLLKAVSGEFKDELNTDAFDDHQLGAANSGGPLITEELGNWIIDRLPG